MVFFYFQRFSFFFSTVSISSLSEEFEIFWSLAFKLILTCVFCVYFRFFNVSCYSTRIENLMYLVLFCPPKLIIYSFSHIRFSRLPWESFCHTEKHNIISCFLSSFAHPVEFFFWHIFLIFQLWINNVLKSDLVSVVTAHIVYFLCFHSLWNLSNLPIFWKACLQGRTNENVFYWK